MNEYENLSLLISAAALFFSLVSFFKTQKLSEKDHRVMLSLSEVSCKLKPWRLRKKGTLFSYSAFLENSGSKPVHIVNISSYVGESIFELPSREDLIRRGILMTGAFILKPGEKRKISTKIPWVFIDWEKKTLSTLKELFFHIDIQYIDYNGEKRIARVDGGGIGPGVNYVAQNWNEVVVAPDDNLWGSVRWIQKR